MDNVKPYFGSSEDAYRAAMTDDDQYVIKVISNYTGDPELRSNMSFRVLFEDGDDVWIPYNQDLAASAPFVNFCNIKPELKSLLYSATEWRRVKRQMNEKGISGISPGDTCFVNLRAWGWSYVENVGLPNILDTTYVVACRYIRWTNSKKTKVDVNCQLFSQLFVWTTVDVDAYGRSLVLTEDMILIDEAMCHEYPKLLD
jgi:hypothetical protein